MNIQLKYWEKVWSNNDFLQMASAIFGSLVLLVLGLFLTKPAPEYSLLVLNAGWFVCVVSTFTIFLRKKNLSWQELFPKKISLKWFSYSFLLVFFVVLVGGILSKIWSNFLGISSESVANLDLVLSNKVWLNIFNLKIVVAILVPITEELFFKGLIFKFLRQERSFMFSAILSATIFSVFHFSPASIPFTIILGLATAFAFEKTRSIFYSFIIHIGVNSLAASFVLFGLM